MTSLFITSLLYLIEHSAYLLLGIHHFEPKKKKDVKMFINFQVYFWSLPSCAGNQVTNLYMLSRIYHVNLFLMRLCNDA